MAEKSIPNKFTPNKIGDQFGKLTIIAVAESLDKSGRAWLCRCECGNVKPIRQSHLRAKISSSCGCVNRINRLKSITKHGHSYSITYSSWAKLKQRCGNPNHTYFQDYGGRGIKVCERWLHSFENFLEDMGERPSKNYSIDRIDFNGNYEPDNCRWATATTQSQNTRHNRNFTINGETKCLAEWCRIYKRPFPIIRERVNAGKDILEALTKPSQRC